MPAAWNAATARSTASVAPPMTAWPVLLMFATTTYPSVSATMRSISASGASTAAMAPLSPTARFAISRPRALTASSAASKDSAPAATRAPYSPRLWPITMSGRTPYASSMRVSARSVVSTAGWVISVCMSCCSSRRAVASSALSAKTYSVSGLPSSGAITRSASSNVAATSGSCWRRSRSMLTYCEPWPV